MMKFQRSSERGLPANVESEKAILGAVLLGNEAYAGAAENRLSADDFSLDSHKRIYRTMSEMISSGRAVDLITLSEELLQRGQIDAVGGHAYVASLTDGVPPRPNIEAYVTSVRKLAGQRYAVHAADALSAAASDGEEISELTDRLAEIGQRIASYRSGTSIDLTKFPDPMELPVAPEKWLIRDVLLKDGITEMAGAPGEGKTWQALAIARAVAFGAEYLGRKCEKAEVVILDYENPKSIMQARWNTIFGEPVRKYGITLWAPWSGMGDVPKVGDPRLLEIAKTGRLLIFDTLSGAHGAKDENSASEMTPIMAQFRELANRGASILILHHRGKNELSRYRGSSAIAAGFDIGCALIKSDDGFLTLDIWKTRGTPETKLIVQPNYEAGTFELVDSPAVTQHRNDVASLSEAIAQTPGITQSQLIKRLRIGRTHACRLLKRNEGKLWRSESGANRSLKYFPISSCTQYPVQPSTPSITGSGCTAVPTPLGVVQSTTGVQQGGERTSPDPPIPETHSFKASSNAGYRNRNTTLSD